MKAWAQPVAYIRRSVASRADPGDISREFQTEAVRALAGEDVDRLAIIDQDWGRSAATDKTDRRLAFLGLLDRIEAGEVSALYAYSADRLARSVEWSARLLNACRRAGVPIITTQGRVDPGDEAATLLFHVLAATNEAALSGMEKKARASVERRQARNIAAGRAPNHGMGRKPYGAGTGEDVRLVLAGFDEARSFNGAARLLNGCPADCAKDHEHRAKVRTRDGTRWTGTVVGRIVQRERPEVAPRVRRGVAAKAPHIFTGLLLCDCGTKMTSMPRHAGVNGQKTDTVGYFCPSGRSVEGHPKPYVIAESKVRSWAEEVLKEYTTLATARMKATGAPDEAEMAASRAALERKRGGVGIAFAAGAFGDPESAEAQVEMRRQVAEVNASIARLDSMAETREVILTPWRNVPLIDLTGDPADVNWRLRRVWKAIRMRHYQGRFEPALPDWQEGAQAWAEGRDVEDEA